MILCQMPDLPPAPETAANAGFRRWFYERWGRENALVCGRARRAEYSPIVQCLSVKMTLGGAERYLLARRELRVSHETLLILNEGSRYGSRLEGEGPVQSLAVFFRSGLIDEVRAARRQALGQQLDAPAARAGACGFEFSEHLRPRHPAGAGRLLGLWSAAQAGERSEDWLEQQLLQLAGDMLDAEGDLAAEADGLAAMRRATRAELLRRLRRAADLIESAYERALVLDDLAAAACLSRYHFVRHFTAWRGLSPCAALNARRARAARQCLAAGTTDRDAVATRCGFGSRWALQRALRRFPEPDPDPGPAA